MQFCGEAIAFRLCGVEATCLPYHMYTVRDNSEARPYIGNDDSIFQNTKA